MVFSLGFTTWLGLGQILSLQYNKYSSPVKEITIEGCLPDYILPPDDDDDDGE